MAVGWGAFCWAGGGRIYLCFWLVGGGGLIRGGRGWPVWRGVLRGGIVSGGGPYVDFSVPGAFWRGDQFGWEAMVVMLGG